MRLRHALAAAAALLITLGAAPAHAAALSALASDNATVQPAGPRGGGSGKAFFNIEGSANGTFASYGVADFGFGVLPGTVIGVNSATIELVQSNAGFSTTGVVLFSLDQTAAPVDIQPGTSPLAFDGAEPGTATDVSQGELMLVGFGGGPFTYAVVASGQLDSYALTIGAVAQAELVSRLNAAQPIRIVVGTGEAGVAATWAGYTNSTYTGPTLKLDVTYDTGTPTHASTWGRIKTLYR